MICNNLSLVHLKLKNNSLAETFATESISKSPTFKAYLRRAQAKYNQGDYLGAMDDCNHSLAIEDSFEAKRLRQQALEKHGETNGVRLCIQDENDVSEVKSHHGLIKEVDSDDDEASHHVPIEQVNSTFHRIPIEEVDSDDEEAPRHVPIEQVNSTYHRIPIEEVDSEKSKPLVC